MKMLIVGGNGMAGHMLVRYFRQLEAYTVFYTSRDPSDEQSLLLDVTDVEQVDRAVELVRPHIIINAVGLLNEAAERNPIEAYQVNSFLPHRLRQRADRIGAKVVHISTDCVFSGAQGGYMESDEPDGVSMYAVTKALGELRDYPPHLTLRTSIIGPEIRPHGIGLLSWFMQQKGTVAGYKSVWWNGVTTLELAKAIQYYLNSTCTGLIHLANPTVINKHDLLGLFQYTFNKQDVTIVPNKMPEIDRTLVISRSDALYQVPDYDMMLKELGEWMGTP
ncbi:SDR family oxidoreductase [Paenibacillus sp. ACRRX]|uniref:SDR family oxidoreductase n=1 Tax=Paenibacillus sp. ACRRX TaxID=2918206 RepID=UPI001EF3D9C3|nr:SDR family oxidoreductase [Paenibacillus sp. ACRRX]MCG7410090.1 SDR family oxidoreductase [Paenibacillus sp. ACRRX]